MRTLALIVVALAGSACVIPIPISAKVRGVVLECASRRPISGARISLTHDQLSARRLSALSDPEGLCPNR